MAKIARIACETCGSPLAGPRPWFSRHAGKGVQHLCPDCTHDALGRLEAEARQEIGVLEALWQLPCDVVGDGADDAVT
jgi:hypothetical protein